MENEELWSKAYLPATKTTEARSNNAGKVTSRHVQIRLAASNKALLGCKPLSDWLRNKRCIYAVDTFNGNMCVWHCLAIYKRNDIKRGTEFVIKVALT